MSDLRSEWKNNNIIFSNGIKSFVKFSLLFFLGEKYVYFLFGSLGVINKKNKAEYDQLSKLSRYFRKRFFAFSIDCAVGAVFYFLCVIIVAISGLNVRIDVVPNLQILFISLVLIFIEELIFCQTVGKNFFRLTVLTEDYEHPGIIAIIIRNLSKFSLLFSVTSLIFFVVPIISINNRFLDDILAKTTLVPKPEFNNENG